MPAKPLREANGSIMGPPRSSSLVARANPFDLWGVGSRQSEAAYAVYLPYEVGTGRRILSKLLISLARPTGHEGAN